MLLPNCKHKLVFSLLILCFLKYEWNHLPASPHNYEHDGLLMSQVRPPTSPHINGAHDQQHFNVGEPEPPQGSPDNYAHDRHHFIVGAPERPTTSPQHSTISHKSKKRTTSRKSKKIIFWALGISVLSVLSLLVLLLLIIYLFCRRNRGRGNDVELQATAGNDVELQSTAGNDVELQATAGNDVELQSTAGNDEELQATAGNDVELQPIEEQPKKCEEFNFHTILEATQNFVSENKLGEGGFGPVYKGTLADGKEIAVKRLKSTSGTGSLQGKQQFMNEVDSIPRLEHKNIVQLLGYCCEVGEMLLIYEFMPNKSLDVHLFGPDGHLLFWRERRNIIIGIAEGLLKLHADLIFKIIHRDIKPSNILIDHGLNPKISDFGLAKLLRDDQIEANTDRPTGTYGYMAPEYCMGGVVSPKSDVYSFGVVLLEIISGKQNGKFYRESGCSLLIYIWELWRNGRSLELVDEAVPGSCDSTQNLLRFINIGLLCVQEKAEDRPSMSYVLHNLESTENIPLPVPNKPPFYGDQPNLEASQL